MPGQDLQVGACLTRARTAGRPGWLGHRGGNDGDEATEDGSQSGRALETVTRDVAVRPRGMGATGRF